MGKGEALGRSVDRYEDPGRVNFAGNFMGQVVAALHGVARAGVSSRGGVQVAGRTRVNQGRGFGPVRPVRAPAPTGVQFKSPNAGNSNYFNIPQTLLDHLNAQPGRKDESFVLTEKGGLRILSQHGETAS